MKSFAVYNIVSKVLNMHLFYISIEWFVYNHLTSSNSLLSLDFIEILFWTVINSSKIDIVYLFKYYKIHASSFIALYNKLSTLQKNLYN